MREVEVDGLDGRSVADGSCLDVLDLVDEDITSRITHSSTLVLMDDSVVAPCLAINKVRYLGCVRAELDVRSESGITRARLNDNDVSERAEGVLYCDGDPRESGNREGNT